MEYLSATSFVFILSIPANAWIASVEVLDVMDASILDNECKVKVKTTTGILPFLLGSHSPQYTYWCWLGICALLPFE